jgi:hypothetical protein
MPGFNIRGVPVRCTNHPHGVNVPATKVFGYRRYCPSCAAWLGKDETPREIGSLRSEGVDAVRGFAP